MPQRKLQVVWPKDGFQGKSRTGFGSRLSDILKGKGPDMFIQLKGSRDAIRADRWGNWRVTPYFLLISMLTFIRDSYHLPREHFVEQLSHNGLWNISRGMKRYDPETRTYKEWLWPLDWQGTGVGGFGTAGNGDGYPRFTRREPEHVRRQLKLGGPIDPRKVGPDWDDSGPKVWFFTI